jgi:hypothetical protein
MWPFPEEKIEYVGGPFCGETTRRLGAWVHKLSHAGIVHVYQYVDGAYRHCPTA